MYVMTVITDGTNVVYESEPLWVDDGKNYVADIPQKFRQNGNVFEVRAQEGGKAWVIKHGKLHTPLVPPEDVVTGQPEGTTII